MLGDKIVQRPHDHLAFFLILPPLSSVAEAISLSSTIASSSITYCRIIIIIFVGKLNHKADCSRRATPTLGFSSGG